MPPVEVEHDGVPCNLEENGSLRTLVIPDGRLAEVTSEYPYPSVRYRVTSSAGVEVMQALRLTDLKAGYELYEILEAASDSCAALGREGYLTNHLSHVIHEARRALDMFRYCGADYLLAAGTAVQQAADAAERLAKQSPVELWLKAVFAGKVAGSVRAVHTANLAVMAELDHWHIRVGDENYVPRFDLGDLRDRYRSAFADGERSTLPTLAAIDFVPDLGTIRELAEEDEGRPEADQVMAPSGIVCVNKKDTEFTVPVFYRYVGDKPQTVATFNTKQIGSAKSIARPPVGSLWIMVVHAGEVAAEGTQIYAVEAAARKKIAAIRNGRRDRPGIAVAQIIVGHIIPDQGKPPWTGRNGTAAARGVRTDLTGRHKSGT